jgi:hypothetical protein
MREFRFDRTEDTPIVRAILVGPKRSIQARLVFDSGASRTQIRASTARRLGFTDAHRIGEADLIGVEGKADLGSLYLTNLIFVLGKRFERVTIAAFPMSHLEREGIDGLLGWDIIRELRLEMDGPAGILKVY